MSNKIILYNVDLSPPVRVVKVVAKLIGVEFEIRLVNTLFLFHISRFNSRLIWCFLQ